MKTALLDLFCIVFLVSVNLTSFYFLFRATKHFCTPFMKLNQSKTMCLRLKNNAKVLKLGCQKGRTTWNLWLKISSLDWHRLEIWRWNDKAHHLILKNPIFRSFLCNENYHKLGLENYLHSKEYSNELSTKFLVWNSFFQH